MDYSGWMASNTTFLSCGLNRQQAWYTSMLISWSINTR